MPDVHMALTTNGDKMSGQLQNTECWPQSTHVSPRYTKEERYASLMGQRFEKRAKPIQGHTICLATQK